MKQQDFFSEFERKHGMEFSEEERQKMIAQDFCCSSCQRDFRDEYMDFMFEDNEIMCYECYEDRYQNLCPICQDFYDKPTTPQETYFVITKEGEEETGMKAGVYQAVKFPIFSASYIGDTHIWKDSVKLLRECDVASMHKKIHNSKSNELDFYSEFVCECCADFYSKENLADVRELYFKLPLHRKINIKGILKQGK